MVWNRTEARALLVVALLLVIAWSTGTSGAEVPEDCDVDRVAGIGPACLRPDGLYEVFSADGDSLGFVHGTDPVPEDDLAPVAARPPACVHDPEEGYFARVIYAWARDSGPTQSDATVRGLVESANGVVHEEAAALGAVRDLRVLCQEDGLVDVLRVRLPTSLADTTFSSVVQDLRAMSATFDTDDDRVHYWVYFQDRISCGCAGVGHVGNDPTAGVTNVNNGEGIRYAVTFGYLSTRVMLHERSHNNGAVQLSSPNSSGGWHCNDGQDIMCYADGGSRSDYTWTVCSTQRFDCNNDDYFHPDPPTGSYLSYAWNLGHVHNRMMRGCQEATGVLDLATGPVDLPGPVTTVAEVAVPSECGGRPFLLEGWLPRIETAAHDQDAGANLDVCWFDGSTPLGCQDGLATRESGVVPEGADRALIQAKAGAEVRYFLRMG